MLSSTLLSGPDGLVLSCAVPRGVTIKSSGTGGFGIFATSAFRKGEVVYTGEFHFYWSATDISVAVETDAGRFPMSLYGHAVHAGRGLWRVYSFDSFINHSCEANTTDLRSTKPPTAAGGQFQKIALRDIVPGTELTSDYDMFIYNYAGIAACRCGARSCRRYSYGFKHYPEAMRSQVLDLVDPDVLAEFRSERGDAVTSGSL
jgi:hypothetical protein